MASARAGISGRKEGNTLKKIYICSPLRGDYEKNIQKAIGYCREVALAGDLPIAPHVYCTRFLDDTKPEERKRGLVIGTELLEMCSEVRVYGDYISEGMQAEIRRAGALGITVRYEMGEST